MRLAFFVVHHAFNVSARSARLIMLERSTQCMPMLSQSDHALPNKRNHCCASQCGTSASNTGNRVNESANSNNDSGVSGSPAQLKPLCAFLASISVTLKTFHRQAAP